MVSPLAGLFEHDRDDRSVIALDETKITIDGAERYVGATLDTDTVGAVLVEVSAGQSSLNALLFRKGVYKRYRSLAGDQDDRGP